MLERYRRRWFGRAIGQTLPLGESGGSPVKAEERERALTGRGAEPLCGDAAGCRRDPMDPRQARVLLALWWREYAAAAEEDRPAIKQRIDRLRRWLDCIEVLFPG